MQLRVLFIHQKNEEIHIRSIAQMCIYNFVVMNHQWNERIDCTFFVWWNWTLKFKCMLELLQFINTDKECAQIKIE